MNNDTYRGTRDMLLGSAATEDQDLWCYIEPYVGVDESVPQGMVRMAGNRYVRRDDFLRLQRREMRNRGGR